MALSTKDFHQEFHIREGNIIQVVKISNQIPEFNQPHQTKEYEKRLGSTKHLILVAFDGEKPVGFKVGYQKENDGSFYSWMGGILPNYRKQGLARLLADHQEVWAKDQGYVKIKMKTRNRLKPMLFFALNNGFKITAVKPGPDIEENRILLEKWL